MTLGVQEPCSNVKCSTVSLEHLAATGICIVKLLVGFKFQLSTAAEFFGHTHGNRS